MVKRCKQTRTKNQAASLQHQMDRLKTSATLINGKYIYEGSSTAFRSHSINLPHAQQPTTTGTSMMTTIGMVPIPHPGYMIQQEMMLHPESGGSEAQVLQATITLAGNKTKPANNCCYILTILFGGCLIIPLFFMCCMWWKKIVYPAFQIPIDAYQALADLIRRLPNLNHLSLTVVDNAFNGEKARILYDALSCVRTRITGFNFLNKASACNGQFNQADHFSENMAPIKSLQFYSSIVWGNMIV